MDIKEVLLLWSINFFDKKSAGGGIVNSKNNNNNNNNNNNIPETRKYWVDFQRGIVSSHGERDPL